jgi:hypothetical protein
VYHAIIYVSMNHKSMIATHLSHSLMVLICYNPYLPAKIRFLLKSEIADAAKDRIRR